MPWNFENAVDFSVDVLQAMKMLKKSWDAVTDVVIRNCYAHVGFRPQEMEEEEQDIQDFEADGIWSRLAASGLIPVQATFGDFVDSDSDVVVRQPLPRDILAREAQVEKEEESDDDDEDDDSVEPPPPPTTGEALHMVKRMQYFLECTDNVDPNFMQNLSMLESFVMDKALSKKKQSSILKFMH